MAGESNFYRRLRDWAYKEYGHINLSTGEGLIKIFKMAMVGGHGEGGWPDMAIFVRRHRPPGYTFFIELKNPDGSGETSELQAIRQAELRALGFAVYQTEDDGEAKRIIREEINKVRKPEGARQPRPLKRFLT